MIVNNIELIRGNEKSWNCQFWFIDESNKEKFITYAFSVKSKFILLALLKTYFQIKAISYDQVN